MNLIKDYDITYRWYYRTNHYYIQTSVDNEIWLNGKKFVVKADSFLCDSFVTPIHVQSAKPVHVLNIHMVPRDPNRPRNTSNHLEHRLWVNSNIHDVTYASAMVRTPELQLATPPNLITVSSGNCVLAYAWNSDTVNVNGKTIRLRYRHGNNYYDTFGTRQSSTLYTIRNQAGVTAVYMALTQEHPREPTGGVHSLDPVPPVWQNRIAINRPAANWEGFDDTGRAFVCRNSPARLSAETGLDSPHQVYWYLQNVLVDSGAVVQYTFKDTGSYRLRGQFLFKSPGCYAGLREENLYRTISVYSDLHEKLPNDTLLCVGNSVSVQRPFNARDRYRYFYNGGRLACDTCSAQVLRPGRNNLMLRMQVTRAGCKDVFRDTLRLFLRDSLKLQTSLPDTLCHGSWNGPLLQAKGGDSSAYRFSFAIEGREVLLPLYADTAFTLRLSIGDGCSAPADTLFKRIAVRPALQLSVPGDTTICYGTAWQPRASASGGRPPYNLTWYRGQTLHSDTQSQYSDTTLMAVLEDGCSRPDTAFVTLRVLPRLAAAFNKTPAQRLCTDGILRFDAAASGGMGKARWLLQREGTDLAADTGKTFAYARAAQAGNYRLLLRDACPDTAVLAFALLGPDKFKVRWNLPDTLCPNSGWQLGLQAQGSDSLLWLESHPLPAVNPLRLPFRSSDTLLNMQALASGSYNYLFTAGDGCMLPDSVFHSLQVTSAPALPADTVIQRCASEMFDYPLSAAKGWMNRFSLSENALPAVPATAISDQRVQGTRYTVEVIDHCGNRDQQSVELRRLQAFSGPLLVDTTLCPDEPLPLLAPAASTALFQPASANLQWQLGSQQAAYNWNHGSSVPVPAFSTPAAGLYRLRFSWAIGTSVCDSLSSSLRIYPAPVAAFSANKTRTFIEYPDFSFSNTSSGALRYQWQVNGSDSGTAFNLRFVAGDTGFFRILLSAFSAEGCWDTASLQVRVVQLFRIFLPNAFTPGNDRLNEVYAPSGTAIGSYTMRIFNRWGQMVYLADEKHPFTGHDHSGRPLPEGVYAVSAEVRSVHGERAFLQTTVHVLR